jgi:hypothetical protein
MYKLRSSSDEPPLKKPTYIIHKRGVELLNDPWYNKGAGSPFPERDRLGLRGLLPPRHVPIEVRAGRRSPA